MSHVVHDHTSVLRFIETKFNLGALTRRDANADNLLDCFDFSHRSFREPPTLAAPGPARHREHVHAEHPAAAHPAAAAARHRPPPASLASTPRCRRRPRPQVDRRALLDHWRDQGLLPV